MGNQVESLKKYLRRLGAGEDLEKVRKGSKCSDDPRRAHNENTKIDRTKRSSAVHLYQGK